MNNYDELRQAEAKATLGPWKVELTSHHNPDGERDIWSEAGDTWPAEYLKDTDAELIVLMRNNLLSLLDENAALRAALNEACDWLKRVQEHYDPTDSEEAIQDIERLRRGDAS